ncbi:MAG: CHASE2 domain-containing protein [Myxococcaceae bacterium]
MGLLQKGVILSSPVPASSHQSAARRFLSRLSYSFAQAALFGALIGGLVYFRVPRRVQEETRPADRSTSQQLRLWLEVLELQMYDWRARQLGRDARGADDVVLGAFDDESIAHARQSGDPSLSVQPWSRELLGGVMDQAAREGASLVLMDFLQPDLSPRSCASPTAGGGQLIREDDEAYRRLLDGQPGRAALAFTWTGEPPPPVTPPLFPWLLQLGERSSEREARDLVRRILADGRPAYVIPDGQRVRVYSGVSSEADARMVTTQWGLKELPELRPRSVAGSANIDRYRFSAERLLVSLSEVQVEGLRPEGLLSARSVQSPVVPLLGEKSLYGSIRLRPDADGRVRGVPNLVNYEIDGSAHVLPSLALTAAMQRLGTRTLRYEKGRLYLGDRASIPMDENGFSLLEWDAAEAGRGARGSLHREIGAWRLIQNLSNRRAGEPPRHDNDLKDRVLILADTSTGASHFRRTPIGERVAGAAIQGQAILNLVQSKGIARAERRVDLAATIACAFVGAFLALTLSGRFRSLLGALSYVASLLIAAGGYAYFARHIFVTQQIWLAMAGPLLAMAGAFAVTTVHVMRGEAELKELVAGLLGRYVAPDVARRVRRDLSLMRPERREVTIYFGDLDNFTRMVDTLEPATLVELLNEFLTQMTQVVRGNRGQVDKYMGDSMMAFWGAPVSTEEHAIFACQSALQMREVLAKKRKAWEDRYGYTLEFRAGLATGQAVVGDMGSEQKSSYTATGAVVNLAWWLEGANRVYGSHILVSESTAQAASDVFSFREIDRVKLRGFPRGVRIFELLGVRGGLPAERTQLLEVFLPAMTAYQERKFEEALELFSSCVQRFNDAVSSLYVARCKQHLAWPPPTDWNGLHESRER